MIHSSQPIGLFDSGIGGLSVWREVTHLLPAESTVYVADSAWCPYGPRPIGEIVARARQITRFLLDRQCKLIVVACNTASAAALHTLRAEFDVPFVGMEPAIKPAAQATKTGHVGVLATAGTLQGELFRQTSRRFAHGIELHVQVGKGLVEQVEAGQLQSPQTEQMLRTYLAPMLAAGADQIVLGCTHYPLLMPLIQRVVNGQSSVLNPAYPVARQVQRLLHRHNLLCPAATDVPAHTFFTTGPARHIQLPFNQFPASDHQTELQQFQFESIQI
jgi:glutamate racemase